MVKSFQEGYTLEDLNSMMDSKIKANNLNSKPSPLTTERLNALENKIETNNILMARDIKDTKEDLGELKKNFNDFVKDFNQSKDSIFKDFQIFREMLMEKINSKASNEDLKCQIDLIKEKEIGVIKKDVQDLKDFKIKSMAYATVGLALLSSVFHLVINYISEKLK